MTISYLPASGYITMPWKNGNGSTDEVCLLPADATRDGFELRVSRATISDSGAFSSFSGVERTITLIEGEGLELRFDDRDIVLSIGEPYRFDSSLTPIGTPTAGVARVLNVMAARNTWQIASASVISECTTLQPPNQGLIVVFALRGPSTLMTAGQTFELNQGDTALLHATADLSLVGESTVLTVPLKPATTG